MTSDATDAPPNSRVSPPDGGEAYAQVLCREQVLNAAAVASRPGLYVIGPYVDRVNFASQQMRAINLAWALTSGPSPVLAPENKVAVVGAGLAGLSLAAGLRRRGLAVEVFERHRELMPIQRYTTSRYVHPTLNFWPSVPYRPTTNFPFLNWSAHVCQRVIANVERQWRAEFADNIAVHFEQGLQGISSGGGHLSLDMETGRRASGFSAVLLTVGFCREEPVPGALAPSYWDDEDLRRTAVTGRSESFVVSGAGDGGILEVLRLAYGDFAQGQITAQLARRLDATALPAAVEDFERRAEQSSDEDARCEGLRSQYLDVELPPDVAGFLDNLLARGFPVTLLSRQKTPFTLKSAPVHRIMLARAIQQGRVETLRGTLGLVGGRPVVTCDDGSLLRMDGRPFVVRHGPPSALSSLLTENQEAKLRANQGVLGRYQFKPFWPSDYFGAPASSSHSEKKMLVDNVRHCTDALREDYPGLSYISVVSDGGLPVCELVVEPGSGFCDDEAPVELFGFKTRVVKRNMAEVTAFARSHTLGQGRGGAQTRPLREGDTVRCSPTRYPSGRQGVIGCFLRRKRADALAVTAGHVLAPEDEGAEVYASAPEHEDWQLIGSVEVRQSAADDIATIRLLPSISFQVAVGTPREVVSGLTAMGEQVVSVRSDGTPTRGVVRGLAFDVPMRQGTRILRLAEAVIVEPATGGDTFAEPGDSGALVSLASGAAIGIVVAISGRQTFVSPLGAALDELGAEIATEGRGGEGIIEQSISASAPATEDRPSTASAAIQTSSGIYRHTILQGDIERVFVRWFNGGRSAAKHSSTGMTSVDAAFPEGFAQFQINSRETLKQLVDSPATAGRDLVYISLHVPPGSGSSVLLKELRHIVEVKHSRSHSTLGTAVSQRGVIRGVLKAAAKGNPVPPRFAVALTEPDGLLGKALPPRSNHEVGPIHALKKHARVNFHSFVDPAVFSLDRLSNPHASVDWTEAVSRIATAASRLWADVLAELLLGDVVTRSTAVAMGNILADIDVDGGAVVKLPLDRLAEVRVSRSERLVRGVSSW